MRCSTGSILGSNLCINDLSLCISHLDANCDLFADDTTIHSSDKDIATINKVLQQSLDEVCSDNHMIISISKTKSMLVTTRQKHQRGLPPLTLSLDSQPIEQVTRHRLLGIIVDNQLSWEPHTGSICKTISQNLFLLSKLRHIVNTDIRKLFFNAHIKTHCDYSSTVWERCSEVHIKKIISCIVGALN